MDPKIFQPENQPAVPLAPIDPTIELIKPIDQLQAETIRSNAKRQVDAQLLAGRRALLQDQGIHTNYFRIFTDSAFGSRI